MKNVSAFLFLLALNLLGYSATAQSKVPSRGPVSADNTVISPQSGSSAPATTTPSSATATEEADDQANVVLFTGTVKQEKLKALPGATIYVKSTRQMAVADENGDFSLELDFASGPVDLEVSYAGFEDQVVTITDPNTFLVVSMNTRKKK